MNYIIVHSIDYIIISSFPKQQPAVYYYVYFS